MAQENPFAPFLRRQPAVVLDGGLATTLEARGCVLDDALWSARVLLDDPGLIRDVHRDFLRAGADCISTVTYQATIPALTARGLGESGAEDLIRLAVHLAIEAREDFLAESRVEGPPGDRAMPTGAPAAESAPRAGERIRPLVAASVGPYGAYLADGSEYTGDYGLDRTALRTFHARRWEILAASGADLLACETIPSRPEALALADLLEASPGRWAWFSFQCRDGAHLADGSPLGRVVADLDGRPGVAAVGVNCVSPGLVPELMEEIRLETELPVIVYPNSGEAWDADAKRWIEETRVDGWEAQAPSWVERGACIVGGCCRTGPERIARIRRLLVPEWSADARGQRAHAGEGSRG